MPADDFVKLAFENTRAAVAREEERRSHDCLSCGEVPDEDEKCPKSEKPCGHHCNHSWTHDICDWCRKEWGEDDN